MGDFMKGLRKAQIVMMWLWIIVCVIMTWAANAPVFPYMYLINVVLIYVIGSLMKRRYMRNKKIRKGSQWALVLSDQDNYELVRFDMLVAGAEALLSFLMMYNNQEFFQWVMIFSFDIILVYIGINYADKKWFSKTKEASIQNRNSNKAKHVSTATKTKQKYQTGKKKK